MIVAIFICLLLLPAGWVAIIDILRRVEMTTQVGPKMMALYCVTFGTAWALLILIAIEILLEINI